MHGYVGREISKQLPHKGPIIIINVSRLGEIYFHSTTHLVYQYLQMG
jgi:hypothetical protein